MLAFDFLNAVCFTIALGSPMILTVRFLGGGEALIGFLMALTPLLTMLQIPAVRYADRWGYRRLMMAGWRIRAVMVLLLAPLPLFVNHLPGGVLLVLFTLLLLLFNLIRGFASGCWLPWMKALIPSDRLGRFMSRESIAMGLASLLTLLGCGWFLGQSPPAWHYAVILLISGLSGLASVLPLRTVPYTEAVRPAGDEAAPTLHLLRRVWALDDFRRLIYFMACNNAALAATGGFLVLYLKEAAGMSAGEVVILTALGSVGSMVAAIPMGKYLDQVGSKPVMRAASIAYLAIFATWVLHALFHLPSHFVLVAPLVFAGGMIGTGSGLATGRLMINLCPHDQATAGIALAQVVQATASGLATVLWGFLLQWLRAEGWYGQHSRVPFILFFLITLTGLAGAYHLLFKVREPAAMSSSRFLRNLALEWPRSWLRL